MMTTTRTLDDIYQEINDIILSKQHPITGLLPASTAITHHGDYTDAWVRDNVYSILAVWGLGLAYQKRDDEDGRSYELLQSVVKLMRGLLQAMMRQADKVERFKTTQNPRDALHAKYDTETALPVVDDDAWGHLQIDATSLYLLMIAQMTASGLRIVYTLDEVNFVQNLVHYISRAYRTPDFGIWERGGKSNMGTLELNSSSIGMAKAALEALSGFNLFGTSGSQASVVHVLPDDIARASATLEALLPRESGSKEVDSAILSIISYPAFAINDRDLVARCKHEIISKLEGNYGLKRFLRDGHQTVLEDDSRLHYEAEELYKFEHIESEWPLFYTYLLLDGLMTGDAQQVAHYHQKILGAQVSQGPYQLLPELYYVPAEAIAEEKARPHSQQRQANDNLPLVWAQSLWLLAQMLQAGHLNTSDIDPLKRRYQLGRERKPVVQLALLSEDASLKAELEDYGIATETQTDVFPVAVRYAGDLASAYEQVGRNEKLSLTGRPKRRLKSLSTARLYRLGGETMVFPALAFDQSEFYLTFDPDLLMSGLRQELAYLHRRWTALGRPTLTLLITRDLLALGQEALLTFLQELCGTGSSERVPVKVDTLARLQQTATLERIDFLHDVNFPSTLLQPQPRNQKLLHYAQHSDLEPQQELAIERISSLDELSQRLAASHNLYEQVELLAALAVRGSLDFRVSLSERSALVKELLEEVYQEAGKLRLWAVLRKAAGVLNKTILTLEDAITDLLAQQHTVMVGRAYSNDAIITRPLDNDQLIDKINTFCRDDMRDRVLTQEIIYYLGRFILSEPELFDDILSLRIGNLILLLTAELALTQALTQDQAYDRLMHLSPSEVEHRLHQALYGVRQHELIAQQESLQSQHSSNLEWQNDKEEQTVEGQAPEGWLHWRQHQGALSKIPKNFYPSLWHLFEHTKGIVIGDKLERRNRIKSSHVISDMTPGEANFARLIEHLLLKIQASEYRQLTLETLQTLTQLSERNPEMVIDDYLVLDVLIGHAVRLAYVEAYPENATDYQSFKAEAWWHFYDLSPAVVSNYIVKALQFLLDTH